MNFLEITGFTFWMVFGMWVLFWLITQGRDLYKKYKRWIKK